MTYGFEHSLRAGSCFLYIGWALRENFLPWRGGVLPLRELKEGKG